MTTLDLRAYFPDSATVLLNRPGGAQSTKYTFLRNPRNGLDGVYSGYQNIGKAGVPYQWQKQYWRNGAWCTDTYAILFMSEDLSVTETGDWYSGSPCTPNVVLGYKTPTGVNTGLAWAPVGGISESPSVVECNVWRQNTPGSAYTNSGVKAFSRTGLIDHFDTFTPKFGRDECGVWREGGSKEYTDVIHLVMYHGTKYPNETPIRCTSPLAVQQKGPYYQSFKDYNSYAIELWMANGIGIIQENCPFIEKGWDSIPNCSGDIYSGNPGSWVTYIDQQRTDIGCANGLE